MTITDDTTFYPVYSYTEGGSGGASYTKVTSTSELADGKYLIVCENVSMAMTDAVDAVSNGTSVTIDNGTIASSSAVDALQFTLTVNNGALQGPNGKYIGNWGGKESKFRFEGIKDGQVVKTVIKGAMTKIALEVIPSADELVEGSTYDVMSFRIRVTDEYGNVLPFFNRRLRAEVSGDAEIIGSADVDINGGMGGVYVRSTGRAGEFTIRISLPDGDASYEERFTVRNARV